MKPTGKVIELHYPELRFPRVELEPLPGREFTGNDDTQVLCWLAGLTRFDIVEIGASDGRTTRRLATHFPARVVHAVDDGQQHGRQGNEAPQGEPAHLAAHLSNVRVHKVDAGAWSYDDMRPGFVFIDGDHRDEAVLRDSLAAIAATKEASGRAIVAWHDYHEAGSELPFAPWVGVGRVVRALAEQGQFAFGRVHGTSIAFAITNPGIDHAYVIQGPPESGTRQRSEFWDQDLGNTIPWDGFDPGAMHATHHDYGGCYVSPGQQPEKQLAQYVSHWTLWQHIASSALPAVVLEECARWTPEASVLVQLVPEAHVGQLMQTHGRFDSAAGYLVSPEGANVLRHALRRRMNRLDLQMEYLRELGLLNVAAAPKVAVQKKGESWL